MDAQEIAQEMLNFMNEFGTYQQFLDWAEERGFDKDDLENDITNEVEMI